jgi:hypothetical protein
MAGGRGEWKEIRTQLLEQQGWLVPGGQGFNLKPGVLSSSIHLVSCSSDRSQVSCSSDRSGFGQSNRVGGRVVLFLHTWPSQRQSGPRCSSSHAPGMAVQERGGGGAVGGPGRVSNGALSPQWAIRPSDSAAPSRIALVGGVKLLWRGAQAVKRIVSDCVR